MRLAERISMLDTAPSMKTEFKKFLRTYGASEIIFEEGSAGAEMFIVYSGRVQLTTNAPGREVVLGEVGAGDFFGEMSLVDLSPRTATAKAVEDGTRLVAIDQAKFLYMVGQQPAFALTIMHALCRRIRERWALYDGLLKEALSDTGAAPAGPDPGGK
jgi:CRP/FNR family cyclic AMP-dependent transcriptional regulator